MEILLKREVVGERPRNWTDPHRFEVITTERPINSQEQREIQRSLGYDPAGYGVGDMKIDPHPTKAEFTCTWTCSHSCE